MVAPVISRSSVPLESSPHRSETRGGEARNRGALGFTSASAEIPRTPLSIEGKLPSWLKGTLYRTGPGTFEAPSADIHHWFMGLAMLVRLELDGSRAQAVGSTRHLECRSRQRAMRRPRFPRLQRAIDRIEPFLDRREITDNGNVNVACFDGTMVAMTETTRRVCFDPITLESQGPFRHHDIVEAHLTTAHPVWDEARGCHFNFATRFGKRSHFVLHRLVHGRRHVLAELPADRPSYMHSIAWTANHLVLLEYPLFVRPLYLRYLSTDFFDALEWKPEAGTRIRAVHKDSGQVHQWHLDQPLFAFHPVDGVEEEGKIHIDVSVYDDASVLQDLELDRLRGTEPPSDLIGDIRRITLGPDGASITALDVPGLELPRVDPRRLGAGTRYAYGVTNDHEGTFVDGLIKIDRSARGEPSRQWSAPGHFPGEAVFVPQPGGEREDDGVVISLVLDPDAERSYFLVLDGQTFEERARMHLPTWVPHGFHGQFVPRL